MDKHFTPASRGVEPNPSTLATYARFPKGRTDLSIINNYPTQGDSLLQQAEIGIMGGSGLYSMPGLTDIREVTVQTPFGEPSDAYVLGNLEGRKVAFLARHGRGHRILPSEINYRANIYGMKDLGVERILSLSAVGSLKEEHKPTDFVIPDQFIDRTIHRISTFFGHGIVVHVAFGDPICPEASAAFTQSCKDIGLSLIHI